MQSFAICNTWDSGMWKEVCKFRNANASSKQKLLIGHIYFLDAAKPLADMSFEEDTIQ